MSILCCNRISLVSLVFFAIILFGLIGFAKAASSSGDVPVWIPHTPMLSDAQRVSSLPEEEDAFLMDETIVEGGFVDPFDEGEIEEDTYDPWEPFNSTMFDFNYDLDRYVLKPVAKGYDFVMPTEIQNSISNAFRNVGVVGRLLNNIFQGKFKNAGIEIQRFLINSTLGVGGFFDVAKYGFEIEPPESEDTGQTLATHGLKPGPYLVIPFLPPTTVRDGFGFLVDTAMNPLNFFVPPIPNVAVNVGEKVNDRSRNLDFFQGIEDSTLDLYGAVRAGYFEKRARAIDE